MSQQGTDERPGLLAQAERIAEDFALTPESVRQVTSHFVRQLKEGLANHRVWQLPSFVRSVPTGKEQGTFLAVDLGGSNCRICLVQLNGDSTFAVTQSRHRVPAEVMVCQSYKPLFDFIAEKTRDFLVAHPVPECDTQEEQLRNKPYRLGFTFSFTCEQTSLAGGTLIRWDKDWDIPGAVGRDPCVMLQEAIDRLELPVLVSVLANDSVGTLLTRSYTAGTSIRPNNNTLAAIIFGTGTNAAYVEKVSNIHRLGLTRGGKPGEIMVMNTEWGGLDDKMEVLPRTQFDDEIDKSSTDPGVQMFEKRVSGLYLGELLRLALVKLFREGGGGASGMVFDKESQIFRRQGIDSSFLSRLAIASKKDLSQTVELVKGSLSAENVTAVDVKAIQLLSSAIVRRAARLAGASLAAIIIQSGRLKEDPQSRSELKHSDAAVEATVYQTMRSPVTSIGRFRYHLSLLWRRILNFFRERPLPAAPVQQHLPKSTETCPEDQIIDIAADGSLIEFYPTFEDDMRGAMREVQEIGSEGERRIRIGLARDGSGVGAALMAQAALETERRVK